MSDRPATDRSAPGRPITGPAVDEPDRRRAHFECFDGLRAIAAIAVVFHHASYATGAVFRNGSGVYLARMDSGVAIFFLISGFLLYRPFVAAHLALRPAPAVRAFLRRRFLRIFPAYWVALLLIALFIGFPQNQELDGIGSWIVHLLLVQVYDLSQFYRGITQSWTLAVEIHFYLFLPLYAWAMRRLAARCRSLDDKFRMELVGLVVLFTVGIVSNALVYWGPSVFVSRVGKAWLPTNLDLFAMGMLFAVLSAWVAERGRAPASVEWVGRIGGWWWGIAAFTFWLVSTQVGLSRAIAPVVGFPAVAEHYLYGIMAFFLLLPAVFGSVRRGLVRGFLRWGPVAWLGLISYGIYLWHQAWVRKALQWTDSQVTTSQLLRGPFWEVLAIVLLCTIPTAALSYYLVEKPLLRLGRRGAESRRTGTRS